MWDEVQVPVSACVPFLEDRGQGCSSSPLQLDIKEGNHAFQLPFHDELNGGVLTVEVPVEGLQEVISMRPDGKDIIYIPKLILGPAEGHLQVFH